MKGQAVWYSIPRETLITREGETVPGVVIAEGFTNKHHTITLGLDGGLSLVEVEDLQWRCKQAIQLLKHGKIRRQRA